MTEQTSTAVAPVADKHAPAAPAITPMQMLQIAVEQNADLDKLTKLMDLQERWEAGQARKAFTAALTAFKADPPRIAKNRHVKFRTQKGETEYHHATLDQVVDVVGQALSKHGLSHTWTSDQQDTGMVKVTCRLTHNLGHSEEVTLRAMPDDSGGKNGIQAIGSTVTYLQRYTLLAATGLATADMDDDGGGGPPEPINESQKERIIDLIKATGADTVAFCKYLGVNNVDEIPARRFDDAVQALERKRAKQ